jgi:hypothetical protein
VGDDPSTSEHGEHVAEPLRLVHIVRGEDDRETLGAQPVDQLPDGDPRLRIEAGRGLVEEEEARAVHDRAGKHQPPLVAARQGVRLLARVRAQLEALEELPDALTQGARPRPEVFRGDQEVLLDGEVAVEGVLLGADADEALGARQVLARIGLLEEDLPRVGGQEAVQHAQGRGLAGAVRAEQAVDLSRSADEIHAIHDLPAAQVLYEGSRFEHWCHAVHCTGALG